jgi:Ran GTPase-activating protein (RanGAP) involved in mRNA processing and transport
MNYTAKVDGVKKWDTVTQITSVLLSLTENVDVYTGIELSGNSIGYDVAKELGQAIEKLTKLRVMFLVEARLLIIETCSLEDSKLTFPNHFKNLLLRLKARQ